MAPDTGCKVARDVHKIVDIKKALSHFYEVQAIIVSVTWTRAACGFFFFLDKCYQPEAS
jgi:hypothetical protein